MLNKKTFVLPIISLLFISSCKDYTFSIIEKSKYWITDNSGFIFKIPGRYKSDKMTDKLYYVNYNFLNSNYSFSNPFPNVAPGRAIYVAKITIKNGESKNLFSLYIGLPNRSKKHEIEVNYVISEFLDDNEKILKTETTERLNTLFSNDTKLIPYELENLFLINTYNICLFNDDINLFSGDNQFSFLTGYMKDNEGNNKEVIFKSISNTQFKVYEFINKKEVGEVLLEGEMSQIKDNEQTCSIDIDVTKDYYFNNKYSSLTLNIKNTTTDIKEEYSDNFEFFFPEDIG